MFERVHSFHIEPFQKYGIPFQSLLLRAGGVHDVANGEGSGVQSPLTVDMSYIRGSFFISAPPCRAKMTSLCGRHKVRFRRFPPWAERNPSKKDGESVHIMAQQPGGRRQRFSETSTGLNEARRDYGERGSNTAAPGLCSNIISGTATAPPNHSRSLLGRLQTSPLPRSCNPTTSQARCEQSGLDRQALDRVAALSSRKRTGRTSPPGSAVQIRPYRRRRATPLSAARGKRQFRVE